MIQMIYDVVRNLLKLVELVLFMFGFCTVPIASGLFLRYLIKKWNLED